MLAGHRLMEPVVAERRLEILQQACNSGGFERPGFAMRGFNLLPSALLRFERRFSTVASARSWESLSEGERARLEAFARGELTARERKKLLPLLSANTGALEYLATLLKGQEAGEEE